MSDLITDGVVAALPKRGISEETCAKWGYKKGSAFNPATKKVEPAQIATYYDEGQSPVAQKVRFANKDFCVLGDKKRMGLYGQHLWRDGGKMVVVTEGEIDALTVSQLQGNKWPVVSIPTGAEGARKSVAKALEWLNQFETVVLMFDTDKAHTKNDGTIFYPGQDAAKECAQLFPPGKCKIATLPMKDPNEMLLAGRGADVIKAMWDAKTYRPDGIVTLKDIRQDILKQPEQGLPWWCPKMTALTYGRRLGEIVTFGAGTGIGKTDFLTQQIKHDIVELQQPVGLFFLEQQPTETGKRVAGKLAGKCFHIPDGSWQQADLEAALDRLEETPLYLYDHFGSCDWDNVRDRIRFMHHSEGVNLFYLDHLTAFAAGQDDERKFLEHMMAQVGGLVKELNIWMAMVSHLATPEGKPHEEGGRVMVRHFKGSRAIGYWSHYMVGFERDQQNEDRRIATTTTVRILKDRYTGRATGKVFYLGYDSETGTLHESEAPEAQAESTSTSGGDDF